MSSPRAAHRELPLPAGIGLRPAHMAEVMEARPRVPWFEVHAENYMGDGPAGRRLERVREDYPIGLHGVGLSLGSAEGIDAGHLRRLKALVDRIEPAALSEHLSWSVGGGVYLNDLLPLPYTEESFEVVARNVDAAQAALCRRLLVENPSAYLRFTHSTAPEPEFLARLAARTGCGLLFDVNNVYVSSRNLGFDALGYVDAIPPAAVEEIHLAGHARNDADGREMLIDDHGSRVAAPVWMLYARSVSRFGRKPTLIEWDAHLPALDVLLAEAVEADDIAEAVIGAEVHACA